VKIDVTEFKNEIQKIRNLIASSDSSSGSGSGGKAFGTGLKMLIK
jgi:hypothetical protein